MTPVGNHLKKKYLAISGGVGGAKLALGLCKILHPNQLMIVGNTGDDFEHLGLRISPDLDTLMYTLAKLNNEKQGWGLAAESWNFLEALKSLGGETWFQLGDRDMATHLIRTRLLSESQSLTEVTQYLCQKLGVQHSIVPMTDDAVATFVEIAGGKQLSFQHYFVKERCQPVVTGFSYDGVEYAHASPPFKKMMKDPHLAAIVICPSNPFISIDPVLSLPGVRQMFKNTSVPIVAVSPIVQEKAIKGPSAKMLKELGMPVSATTVACHYQDFLDGYILDIEDQILAEEIEMLGMSVTVTNTIMKTLEDRIKLASKTLDFVGQLLENS